MRKDDSVLDILKQAIDMESLRDFIEMVMALTAMYFILRGVFTLMF